MNINVGIMFVSLPFQNNWKEKKILKALKLSFKYAQNEIWLSKEKNYSKLWLWVISWKMLFEFSTCNYLCYCVDTIYVQNSDRICTVLWGWM